MTPPRPEGRAAGRRHPRHRLRLRRDPDRRDAAGRARPRLRRSARGARRRPTSPPTSISAPSARPQQPPASRSRRSPTRATSSAASASASGPRHSPRPIPTEAANIARAHRAPDRARPDGRRCSRSSAPTAPASSPRGSHDRPLRHEHSRSSRHPARLLRPRGRRLDRRLRLAQHVRSRAATT